MFLNFMNIMKTSCSFYYSLTDNVASWIVFSRCPFVGVFVNTITHKHLRHYPEIFMGARYGQARMSSRIPVFRCTGLRMMIQRLSYSTYYTAIAGTLHFEQGTASKNELIR